MKIKHLLEGIEPKLPGAVSGIQVMTPQQFVAKSAKGEEPGPEEVAEAGGAREKFTDLNAWATAAKQQGLRVGPANGDSNYSYWAVGKGGEVFGKFLTTRVPQNNYGYIKKQGVAEGFFDMFKSKKSEPNRVEPSFDNTPKQSSIPAEKPAGEKKPNVGPFQPIADLGTAFSYVKIKFNGQNFNLGLKTNTTQESKFALEEVKLLRKTIQSVKKDIKSQMSELRQAHTDRVANRGAMIPGGGKVGTILRYAVRASRAAQRGDISSTLKAVQDTVIAPLDQMLLICDKFEIHLKKEIISGNMGESVQQGVAEGSRKTITPEQMIRDAVEAYKKEIAKENPNPYILDSIRTNINDIKREIERKKQGVAEAEGDLLGAQARPFGGQEFQDYMGRIAGREKSKTDKYKLPYMHRSSVIKYYNEAGQRYDENQVVQALKQRPKKLLKQNEKMKHSNGELEQFFNIGFAALVGIAVDEKSDSLVIVNTCPGAGSCKVDCFAMKGGKVQFEGPWLSDGRILTYLLNEPDQFFNQLSAEITKEEKAGQKGGYRVSIRWHDAGDFFSPEYVEMAYKLANAHPNVQFYAYTKIGDVAIGEKPDNFIINWSEGAHTSQEKKVKAADPNLERTKNSRIVPSDLFYDLLVKDEKKNLVKGPEGQWQVIPDKLPELKQRLAKQYGISANSILSYSEWDRKTDGGKKETPVKYNVIITPGEPDITAKSHSVLSTLLLKH